MKGLILICTILFSLSGFSQVEGEIIADGRKITNEIDYTLESKQEGILVFDIAVNVEGQITSCEWDKVASTVNSMRLAHTSKNRILTQLKFEPGNGFPTFHRGKVTITLILEENEEQ